MADVVRTFYLMIAVGIAVAVIATFATIFGGSEVPAPASRATTTAVEGSAVDCSTLSGEERQRCEQQRRSGRPPE